MYVTPPIVSDDSKLLTKLFSFLILALEKLNEIVTARGRPSGIAHTTTEMAIMMVLRTSIHNLFFSMDNSNEYGMQSDISV